MSYSYFADTIISALGVDVPDCLRDSPSDQADTCLTAIERLNSADSLVARLAATRINPHNRALAEWIREARKVRG